MLRWLAREWVRNPWAWLLALLAILLGPISWLASPIGITTAGTATGVYLQSQWFLSAYLGAIAALLLCSRAGDVWEELGPIAQAGLAGGVAALLGLLHASLAVAPYAWQEGGQAPASVGGILVVAHWAALTAFLQRLPWPLAARCVGLTLLGWWIPALLAADSDWQRLRWILGPARHLELSMAVGETPRGVLADTIPVLAWWVAAALLPPRSAFRR